MLKRLKRAFLVDDRVCPWWLAYSFDNPVRRLIHDPEKILGDYVDAGQTVLDLGCGMGHFSIGMARLVGAEGRVIAVDLQEKMLEQVSQRAKQAGLLALIQLHQCESERIGVAQPLDFALAFWMLHEVPQAKAFLQEILILLKPNRYFLLAEPIIHVNASDFWQMVEVAQSVGFSLESQPRIRLSRAALFTNS